MSDTILSSPPGEQIHLVINKMTEDQYQQLVEVSADMLSTELSNEIFLTYSDSGEEGGGGGGGIPPASYKTYDDTLSSLSNDGYATQQWVDAQGFRTDSVNNATVTFKQGEVVKGSITLNQASDSVITLDEGEPEEPGETERFSSQAVLQACTEAIAAQTPSIVETELQNSNRQLTESLVDQIAEAVLERIQDAGIGREAVDYGYPTFHPTYTSSMYATKITFKHLSAIPSALVENGAPIGRPDKYINDTRMYWRSKPICVDPAEYPDPQLIAVELHPGGYGIAFPADLTNIEYGSRHTYGLYMVVPDGTGQDTYFPMYTTNNPTNFQYNFVAFPGMKFGFFTNSNSGEFSTLFGLSADSTHDIGSITILNNRGFAGSDSNYMMFSNDSLSSSAMTFDTGALVSPVAFIRTQSTGTDTATLMGRPSDEAEWVPFRSVTKNYYGLTAETQFGRFWMPAGSQLAYKCTSPLLLNGTMKASDGNVYKCGQARVLSSIEAMPQPSTSCQLSCRLEFPPEDRGNRCIVEHSNFLSGACTRFRYNDDSSSDCSYYVSAKSSATDDYYMDTDSISCVDFSISSNGTVKFPKSQQGVRRNITRLKIGKITKSQFNSLDVQQASSIYSIELPSNLSLDNYKFQDCVNLSSLKIGDYPENTIPLSLIAGGYRLFYNTGFRSVSVDIPCINTSYSVGCSQMFSNCKNLSSIRVYSNSNRYNAQSISGTAGVASCDNLRKIEEIYGPEAVGQNNHRLWQWWGSDNYATDVLISSNRPIMYYMAESMGVTAKNLSCLTMAGISSFYGNSLTLPYSGPDMRFNLSGSTLKSLPSITYGTTVKHIDLPSTLTSIYYLNKLTSLMSVFLPVSVSSYTANINGMHQLSTGGISFETDQISNVVKVLANQNYASGTTSYATSIYNGNGTIPVYYEATRTSQGTMLGQLTKTAFNITNV